MFTNSRTEFKEWKKKEELKNNVRFFAARSKTQTNGVQVKYFECNRSGCHYRKQKSQVGGRQLKSHGSCRSGFFCPAGIRCEISLVKEVIVDYVHTHIGHSLKPEFVKMDDDHRDMIRADLERGVEPKTVWRNVRNDHTPTKTVRPHNIMSMQTVRNVAKKFDLDKGGQLHASDPVSIDLFVDEQTISGDVIITSYKKQGEMNSDLYGLNKDDFLLCFMTVALPHRPGEAAIDIPSA